MQEALRESVLRLVGALAAHLTVAVRSPTGHEVSPGTAHEMDRCRPSAPEVTHHRTGQSVTSAAAKIIWNKLPGWPHTLSAKSASPTTGCGAGHSVMEGKRP